MAHAACVQLLFICTMADFWLMLGTA